MPVSSVARVFLLVGVPALAADVKRAVPPPLVTFYSHVAPIISRNCSPCHRRGESAPFSLLTYEDVKQHARQIADVTARRYMPPWPPSTGYGDFVEERRLTAQQIRLIQEWVKQGAPSGPSPPVPAAAAAEPEWKLGEPDLVLHVQQPYQLNADGPEVFWNFVMPVPLGTQRWVKAVEIRPGSPQVI